MQTNEVLLLLAWLTVLWSPMLHPGRGALYHLCYATKHGKCTSWIYSTITGNGIVHYLLGLRILIFLIKTIWRLPFRNCHLCRNSNVPCIFSVSWFVWFHKIVNSLPLQVLIINCFKFILGDPRELCVHDSSPHHLSNHPITRQSLTFLLFF